MLALLMWDRRLVAWSCVLVVLAEAVQHATSTPKHPWIPGLHPVSGVAIAGSLTGSLWRSSRVAAAGRDG